jgi:hypothetical protein
MTESGIGVISPIDTAPPRYVDLIVWLILNIRGCVIYRLKPQAEQTSVTSYGNRSRALVNDYLHSFKTLSFSFIVLRNGLAAASLISEVGTATLHFCQERHCRSNI